MARIAEPLGMAGFRPDYQWEDIPKRRDRLHQDGWYDRAPDNRTGSRRELEARWRRFHVARNRPGEI